MSVFFGLFVAVTKCNYTFYRLGISFFVVSFIVFLMFTCVQNLPTGIQILRIVSEPVFESVSTKSGAHLPKKGGQFPAPYLGSVSEPAYNSWGQNGLVGSLSDPNSGLGWPHFVATMGGPKWIGYLGW